MNNKFIKISEEGEFSLWVSSPIYKAYAVSKGFIRNTKTGKNCGKEVLLRRHDYDKYGNLLDTPNYDEDCYEFVDED